jgi:hypothetical protein
VTANLTEQREVAFRITRDELLGEPSYTKSSDLGVIQFAHDYDRDILAAIEAKAQQLRYSVAQKRHLNLKYIRAAHTHIPEINELIHAPGRLAALSELAGVELEVYPLSIITSIITFQGAGDEGSIVWHTDGIPITEMVPLAIDGLVGGDLELFRGSSEVGLARNAAGETIGPDETVRVRHRLGFGILGQLMRVMHRVTPIEEGSRATLHMNLRSARHPYIDDNSMCYLAADNPGLEWQDEYLTDVRETVLPRYLAAQAERSG